MSALFSVSILCCAQSVVLFYRCGSTMKGGGRGKEPSVAGEVTGKRPKRKCLQWHPLLSKKALDFSEEEEEEDEEELEKVSVTSVRLSQMWVIKHVPALH